MTSEKSTLSPEQQHYVSTLTHKKRLYQAHKQMQNAAMTALNTETDPPMFKLAQEISAAAQNVQSAANYMHQQQKDMEQKNPELKTQAIEYSQNRQQKYTHEPQF